MGSSCTTVKEAKPASEKIVYVHYIAFPQKEREVEDPLTVTAEQFGKFKIQADRDWLETFFIPIGWTYFYTTYLIKWREQELKDGNCSFIKDTSYSRIKLACDWLQQTKGFDVKIVKDPREDRACWKIYFDLRSYKTLIIP